MTRRPSPSDVSDEDWEFVAPYLSLLPQTAAQRRHDLREVFNAVRSIVRSIVRTGAPWRWLPTNFPPWEAVYQQTRRWIAPKLRSPAAADRWTWLLLASVQLRLARERVADVPFPWQPPCPPTAAPLRAWRSRSCSAS
jgi:transposase